MRYLASKDEQQLLDGIETRLRGQTRAKYRLLVLLMLDASCRVTEAASMKLHQVQAAKKIVVIRSLKKSQDRFRDVPMTTRLLDALADYWVYVKEKAPESYLFPSKRSQTGYVSRKVIWRVIKNLSGGVYPHMLRHTFCTNLAASGASRATIKELAGHEQMSTTDIYIHASREAKERAIAGIDRGNTWTRRAYRRLFPRPRIDVMPVMYGKVGVHIGRKEEVARLVDLHQKRVNVLLLGEQGMGKTHLLENLQTNDQLGKVLRIDDMTSIRKTLAGLVLTLFQGDKEKVAELLFGVDTDLNKVVTKESIKQLCELLIRTTTQHEYTIIIDDATRITPSGIRVLEQLNEHFHMIIAARAIKIQQVSFLTNFEKIELKGLSRTETIDLITRASQDFTDRIEDWEAYKNHICRAGAGNPKYTLELVSRFRSEAHVSVDMVHRITHTTAVKEIDMSLPVIILLSSLMVLRYLGGEMGSDSGAFKLIGGIFLVFALFARNTLRAGKRRYV
jgi:hypothetical protein